MKVKSICYVLCAELFSGIEALAGRLGATPSVVLFIMPTLEILMRRLETRLQVGDAYLTKEVLADLILRHEELLKLYIDSGYEVAVVRTELTPAQYEHFEEEFYHYLRYTVERFCTGPTVISIVLVQYLRADTHPLQRSCRDNRKCW